MLLEVMATGPTRFPRQAKILLSVVTIWILVFLATTLPSVGKDGNYSHIGLSSKAIDNRSATLLVENHDEESPRSTSLGAPSLLLETSTSDSCRRQCTHRRNKIVLEHLGKEGFDDRREIFDFFTSLAGYLCATVRAPPPYTMLSIIHNDNLAVPQDLLWRDFFTFSFLDDNNTEALKQYTSDISQAAKSPSSWLKLSTMTGPPHASEVIQDIVSQVARLETIVQAQQHQQQKAGVSSSLSITASGERGFVWEIRLAHFYWGMLNFTEMFVLGNNEEQQHRSPSPSSSWPILQKKGVVSGSCPYVERNNADLAQHFVDEVFDLIQNNRHSPARRARSGLAFFHIRRGDTVSVCDTALPRIHRYLMCSLRGEMITPISTKFGNMTLLLASDERDPCYRRAIQTIVEKGLGYNFVDLDEIIWTVLKGHIAKHAGDSRLWNNMYVYHLTRMVFSDPRIDLELTLRRANCPDCAGDMKKIVNHHHRQNFSEIGFHAESASLEALDWNQTLNDYDQCTSNHSVRMLRSRR